MPPEPLSGFREEEVIGERGAPPATGSSCTGKRGVEVEGSLEAKGSVGAAGSGTVACSVLGRLPAAWSLLALQPIETRKAASTIAGSARMMASTPFVTRGYLAGRALGMRNGIGSPSDIGHRKASGERKSRRGRECSRRVKHAPRARSIIMAQITQSRWFATSSCHQMATNTERVPPLPPTTNFQTLTAAAYLRILSSTGLRGRRAVSAFSSRGLLLAVDNFGPIARPIQPSSSANWRIA
jgi:hypothetical protein